MTAYYNEWEPYPAQWLRNLIKAGLIAPGDVDERSIKDVKADDLKGYTQCHFFAGIGGWSYALRLAGWADDRPVWTGSCPCQPFSSAGKQKGKDDERHLWPAWLGLIRECRPSVLFGEQVASAITHGWLDDVYQGLEAESYSLAAAVLPACSIGAPHKRDRLWFVADAESKRYTCGESRNQDSAQQTVDSRRQDEGMRIAELGDDRSARTLADHQIIGRGAGRPRRSDTGGARESEQALQDVAHAERRRLSSGDEQCAEQRTIISAEIGGDSRGHQYGETRWVEPDVGRVDYGVPCSMGRLRAYGNAIVPQVAQAFIESFMEVRP